MGHKKRDDTCSLIQRAFSVSPLVECSHMYNFLSHLLRELLGVFPSMLEYFSEITHDDISGFNIVVNNLFI